MQALFLVVGAAVWSIVAVNTIAMSAQVGEGSLYVLGNTYALSTAAWTWTLSGLAASVGLVCTGAYAYIRGRRLERLMAAELDERWEQVSRPNPVLEARTAMLERRVAELQSQLNGLLAERNALQTDVEHLRRRAEDLHRTTLQSRRSMEKLSEAAIVVLQDLGEVADEDELAAKRVIRKVDQESDRSRFR